MKLPFHDRHEAGRLLGEALKGRVAGPGVIVLALPRGGVPVAYEVAKALGAGLDVFIVRKIGMPGHEELAAGAIASGGVRIHVPGVAAYARPDELDEVVARERRELERREREYRDGRPPAALQDATVVVVDDGLATGASMRAALQAVREQGCRRLVAAVPVAPRETRDELGADGAADDVVCLAVPEPFYAVGFWYADFAPVGDEEVKRLLRAAARPDGHGGA